MTFDELVARLNESGYVADEVVAWRVGPNTPTLADYNIIEKDGRYAVATLLTDRSNGTVLLNTRSVGDGESPYFATAEDACDWVWDRVTDPAFIPVELSTSPSERDERLRQQQERSRRARQQQIREHPEEWEDYLLVHPEERPR